MRNVLGAGCMRAGRWTVAVDLRLELLDELLGFVTGELAAGLPIVQTPYLTLPYARAVMAEAVHCVRLIESDGSLGFGCDRWRVKRWQGDREK